MKRSISQEEARRYLAEVMGEKAFWVNNGPIIKNLEELMASVKTLNEERFRHHVNDEKNDFCKWIDEVIGDKKLADGLFKANSRRSFVKKLALRVNQLKRAAS